MSWLVRTFGSAFVRKLGYAAGALVFALVVSLFK